MSFGTRHGHAHPRPWPRAYPYFRWARPLCCCCRELPVESAAAAPPPPQPALAMDAPMILAGAVDHPLVGLLLLRACIACRADWD
eukprot:1878353-Prymnesium_polylepis.1